MRSSSLAIALFSCASLPAFAASARADVPAAHASQGTASVAERAPATAGGAAGKATAGWVVLGIGGGVVGGGVVLDVIAAGKNAVSGSGGGSDLGTTHDEKTNLFWGGTTMIVAGVLAGIYGGSIVVAARQATIDPQAQRAQDPAPLDPIARAAQGALANTPALVLPIVAGAF